MKKIINILFLLVLGVSIHAQSFKDCYNLAIVNVPSAPLYESKDDAEKLSEVKVKTQKKHGDTVAFFGYFNSDEEVIKVMSYHAINSMEGMSRVRKHGFYPGWIKKNVLTQISNDGLWENKRPDVSKELSYSKIYGGYEVGYSQLSGETEIRVIRIISNNDPNNGGSSVDIYGLLIKVRPSLTSQQVYYNKTFLKYSDGDITNPLVYPQKFLLGLFRGNFYPVTIITLENDEFKKFETKNISKIRLLHSDKSSYDVDLSGIDFNIVRQKLSMIKKLSWSEIRDKCEGYDDLLEGF